MEISVRSVCILVPCLWLAAGVARATEEPGGPAPLWIWLLPGGGQYALGQKGLAAFYAGGTLGLFGWGAAVEGPREGDEVNAPFIYAQQLWVLSMYGAYRDLRIRSGLTEGKRSADPTTIPQLALAPLKPRQLLSPWVFGSALAGAGINLGFALARKDRRGFNDLERLTYLGNSFNRYTGAAAYSAYWIPMSFGAGTSEEALFRGIIQTEAEEHWGDRNGWLAASGLFGLAHLANPGDSGSWGNVAFASLAGLYLGWRYQATGYRLSQPIAAHTWFNIAAGLTLYFVDPENNALGARTQFSF